MFRSQILMVTIRLSWSLSAVWLLLPQCWETLLVCTVCILWNSSLWKEIFEITLSFNVSKPLKFKWIQVHIPHEKSAPFFQNPSTVGHKYEICRKIVFQCDEEAQRKKRNAFYINIFNFCKVKCPNRECTYSPSLVNLMCTNVAKWQSSCKGAVLGDQDLQNSSCFI